MGKYVTVSVKVPREVKERLERLGIKPSQLLKNAIIEELRRRIEKAKPILDRISAKYVVKSIREDRVGG